MARFVPTQLPKSGWHTRPMAPSIRGLHTSAQPFPGMRPSLRPSAPGLPRARGRGGTRPFARTRSGRSLPPRRRARAPRGGSAPLARTGASTGGPGPGALAIPSALALGPGPRPVVGDLGRLVGREGREAVLRDPVLKSDYFSPPGTAVGILDQTLGYDRDGDPEGSRCGWSLARRRPRLLRVGAVRGQGLWDFGRVAGVPARRKVGTFRERLCIDPMDLSLPRGQAGVPAWHLSVTG